MGAKRFIAIAGNIGSGKTTLTTMLSEKYGWDPHYECVSDNPYLSDFYTDMLRWSLPLQVFFLSKRFQAHQVIVQSASSAIQDRSIYEDAHVFAKALNQSGTLDHRDYQNYYELYKTMTQYLTPPDLMIYVRRSVPKLKERIALRGRDYEQDIPTAYLQLLNDCYDQWIEEYRLGKILVVQADNLDFKHRPEEFEYICKSMENSLDQPELFTRC
jgi:deoxyadenosine/deoxycytidine kinase